MKDKTFNMGFASEGFTLFEHWMNEGETLLYVTSDSSSLQGMESGDVIVKRTWAPAGIPEVINRSSPQKGSFPEWSSAPVFPRPYPKEEV